MEEARQSSSTLSPRHRYLSNSRKATSTTRLLSVNGTIFTSSCQIVTVLKAEVRQTEKTTHSPLFRGTCRIGHNLTALREKDAGVLGTTLVGNRIVVACKFRTKSASEFDPREEFKDDENQEIKKRDKKDKNSEERHTKKRSVRMLCVQQKSYNSQPAPKAVCRTCRATEDKNACWHLRCNPPSDREILFSLDCEGKEAQCLREGLALASGCDGAQARAVVSVRC